MINNLLNITSLLCLLFFSSVVNSASVEVFVSILPQQYIVERIGGDQVNVNGGNILGSVDASHGVVNVIDVVLLPPEN